MTKRRTGVALAAAGLVAGSLTGAPPAVAGAPACPLVFGHGGYPHDPADMAKDQVRQPNSGRAVDDQKSWGAAGVEADVQLTREGTKAVMWHNTSTNGLTGTRRDITDIWWAYGSDNLQSRRVSRGPYTGERVYTLREWLDHVAARNLVALLEIKPETKAVLTSGHAARGWKEISDPIVERQGRQRILVYSTDSWIQGELARRHPGLLKGSAARWTDSVGWDEPPPDWRGNTARWQAVLNQAPKSVMTNYTKDYRAWLAGRCV